METKEMDILSACEQLSIKGGEWVEIDGEWIWFDSIDPETEEM